MSTPLNPQQVAFKAMILDGDLDGIRQLLEEGVDPDLVLDVKRTERPPGQADISPIGFTALHIAAYDDDVPLCQLLLEFGANPVLPDRAGFLLLQLAVRWNSPKVVRALLAAGVDPDVPSRWVGPLAMAARDMDLLGMLLAAGARRGLDGALLNSCSEDGSAECLAALLDAGANPSAPEPPDTGDSPRALALFHGQPACLALLRERTKPTTLIDAAIDGNDEALSALLLQGAPVDHEIECHFTALGAAAAMGHERMVSKLLEAGSDPNLGRFKTTTPMARALRAGHLGVAMRLQGAGAIVETALSHLIGRGGREELWTWALAKSPPQAPDILCRATLSGDMAATQALLAHGADPDARDAWGRTPLMIAAWANTPGTARLLLEAGADPRGSDAHGRPLLHYAFTYDDHTPDWNDPDFDPDAYLRDEKILQSETVRLLLDAGAKLPWPSE